MVSYYSFHISKGHNQNRCWDVFPNLFSHKVQQWDNSNESWVEESVQVPRIRMRAPEELHVAWILKADSSPGGILQCQHQWRHSQTGVIVCLGTQFLVMDCCRKAETFGQVEVRVSCHLPWPEIHQNKPTSLNHRIWENLRNSLHKLFPWFHQTIYYFKCILINEALLRMMKVSISNMQSSI